MEIRFTRKIVVATCIMYLSIGLYAQKSALFLGNSYTAYNDLPKLVADIAASLGDSLTYDSNTPGGYTLQGHSTNSTTLQKIRDRAWDYVVLQEQSQRPSFPPTQVQTDVYPYAEVLDSLIQLNDSCTQTLFYMTWGRKYGDQNNCQFYQPLCTYEGMQKRLRDSYLQMAVDNNGAVAPVGMAFKASIQNDSTIDLYAADYSHPSPAGSYLAACVFYSSIFHKSSVGAYYPSSVSATHAFVLQNIANQTVFDSLQTWRIDTTTGFQASFSYEQNGATVQFSDSTMLNTGAYFWDFGDGKTSTDQHPSNTYVSSGVYVVSLTVQLNCLRSTVLDTVNVIVPSVNELHSSDGVTVYPNPSQGVVTVDIPPKYRFGTLQVSDMQGKSVLTKKLTALRQENLTITEPGNYVILIQKGQDQIKSSVVVH